MDTNYMSWLLTGGSVSLPKRILAYMEPMGMSLEELGALIYLLSLDGRVRVQDMVGKQAAELLVKRRFITYNVETGAFDLKPFFERLTTDTGATVAAEVESKPQKQSVAEALTEVVKRFEKEQALFLPQTGQKSINEVLIRYEWDADLVYDFYNYYQRHQRNHYSFAALAQLAFNAGVNDIPSLRNFIKGLDYEVTKVREVLRALGKHNNPSEPQLAMYRKWSQEWGFSHEMIILAIDATTGADNPTMNYLDRVLANWHGEKITTPRDVEAQKQRRAHEQAQQTPSRTRKNGRNAGRYVGNEGYRDFSDMEE